MQKKQPLHVRTVTDSLLFSLSLCGKQNNWCLLNNSIVHKQSVKALLMSQNTIVFTFSLRRRNNSANTITVTQATSYMRFLLCYVKICIKKVKELRSIVRIMRRLSGAQQVVFPAPSFHFLQFCSIFQNTILSVLLTLNCP